MDSGNTAWVLTSAALVMLMTPGLAFFYGGMVRSKSVLNMIMMSLGSMGVVGILWVLFGYSMAFGDDVGLGLLGNPLEYFGLNGLWSPDSLSGDIPTLAFVGFQAMFAIITVALISGAVADRIRFGPWLLFAGLWALVVYFPVAHWVFAFSDEESGVVGGWIANTLGAIDFAGGTAVHINAGAAALALALVLGRRRGWPQEPMRPHNLPMVVLGAALLWFGWFGFNAGSALAADGAAALVLVNTLVATGAAMLAWLLVERIRDKHATTLGAASGIVAGLVAITPAGSSVSPLGAIAVGLISGALCALAVGLKYRFRYDDSLDVVGVHLVGGLVGTLLIGFFGDSSTPAGVDGLFFGGGFGLLGIQAVGAFAVLAYSFVLSLLLALLVKAVIGLRVPPEAEDAGVDESEHAEGGYEFAGFAVSRVAGHQTGSTGAATTSAPGPTAPTTSSDSASPAYEGSKQ
ncbi:MULTISPECIES: ammonium transporter [Actinoalloteichus]|uniref:Ammonium transporter n=1 Tax=Actinoalloteichus fjordicus TaxID=1612552 RepID=A0AAC9PTW5_9PSEU|nr:MULTISPECIES: ammonium transporter [Actinoalloteichus]APU17104.1 ammonium transporter [Actinoalloteichus fjordicus]APU23186.1 ammonium transporter [Actinoalloteichus sp. GBA129-24]